MAVAILRFGCRWTSAGVGDESVESGDTENPCLAVRTVCLSDVEHEIKLLPVWRSPSSVLGVDRRRELSIKSPSSLATPKT